MLKTGASLPVRPLPRRRDTVLRSRSSGYHPVQLEPSPQRSPQSSGSQRTPSLWPGAWPRESRPYRMHLRDTPSSLPSIASLTTKQTPQIRTFPLLTGPPCWPTSEVMNQDKNLLAVKCHSYCDRTCSNVSLYFTKPRNRMFFG